MATKKDSIQDARTQNVSAPQPEPEAASVTIPRRELLTGAALVLVGAASGCGPNAAPGGSSGSGGKCRHPNQLRTKFMADFTNQFIGDSTKIKQLGCDDPWPDPDTGGTNKRLWPRQGQGRTEIVADYATFVSVLLTVGYIGGPPPTYPPGSLAAQILQYLQAQNWPNGTPPPSEYSQEAGTVTLVEIAVIQDRLLQAINSFELSGGGSSGGGSNWPPH